MSDNEIVDVRKSEAHVQRPRITTRLTFTMLLTMLILFVFELAFYECVLFLCLFSPLFRLSCTVGVLCCTKKLRLCHLKKTHALASSCLLLSIYFLFNELSYIDFPHFRTHTHAHANNIKTLRYAADILKQQKKYKKINFAPIVGITTCKYMYKTKRHRETI